MDKSQCKANSLEFTLAIGCALDCKYCPQNKLINKYKEHKCKVMEFDTFKRALSQIKTGGGVIISGMVEPFHNKNCAKMIEYAYKNGFKVRLFTSLTGVTDEDLEILKNIQFDEVTIHIPDENFNSKFKITNEYIRILEKAQSLIGNQISAYSVHGKIHQAVKDLILKDKPIASSMFDRAGNLEGDELSHKKAKGRIRCMAGSKTNIGIWTPEILPDGTITLCCMDYSMKHILGNIVNQDWSQIISGKEYRRILNGFDDESIDILCRTCTGAMQVNELPASILSEKIDIYNKNGDLPDYKKQEWKVILDKITKAKNICIFGLGRMFNDQYFYLLWNETLKANLFSDNSQDLWNKEINNIKCVPPSKLKDFDDLLVITFVKDDSIIREQLNNLGVQNIISIMDIYDVI